VQILLSDNASIPFASNRGARGSNAGDHFHELWALQQALDLLNPGSMLRALTVEGVRTNLEPHENDPAWDGVDCALYFGGKSMDTADRVEIVQLKYSGSRPDLAWSVARLASSSSAGGNNSVLRRLADAFR
jgi:hypothetical protein